jgi:hypothetical protein
MPGPLFPVQNFVAKPFSGSLQGINVSLLSRAGVMTNDGQTLTPSTQSRVVNAQIDFLSSVYKGQAVTINLQSQNNTNPLNKILMIYVDNELNSQNVTIAFPDTQQYIGVPAFTTGYYPVLTGQLLCVVYNGTTGAVPVTAASQVSVIFCNFAIPGFLSQETLDITVNSSTGPVVPVIGDTVSQAAMLGGSEQVNPVVIMPTVTAPMQYVVTGIEVNATQLFTDGSSTLASGHNTQGPNFVMAIAVFENFTGRGFRQFNIVMRPEFEGSRFFNICDETGLNFPCQGLSFNVADITDGPGSFPAVLQPWAAIIVIVTYALVTL